MHDVVWRVKGVVAGYRLRFVRPEAEWCPGRVVRGNRTEGRATAARAGTVQKRVGRVRMHPIDPGEVHVTGESYQVC